MKKLNVALCLLGALAGCVSADRSAIVEGSLAPVASASGSSVKSASSARPTAQPMPGCISKDAASACRAGSREACVKAFDDAFRGCDFQADDFGVEFAKDACDLGVTQGCLTYGSLLFTRVPAPHERPDVQTGRAILGSICDAARPGMRPDDAEARRAACDRLAVRLAATADASWEKYATKACELGDDCELFSGVVLYRRTRAGNRVRIHANSVLGSDGYGYVLVNGRHEKVPQAGWVEVADDVELGACVTVDRGVLGPTRIGAGTKVDNQVQIAHNDQIGKHCLIVSQVGISGSVKVGDYVTLAGKVGVAGHLEIGARSIVGGNSVVAKSLPEGSFVTGFPARPHREWAEAQAALNRLPKLLKDLRRKA